MITAVVRPSAPAPPEGVRAIASPAPGEETRLTRQLLHEGVRRIVAVGGDGFVRNVAAGFFDGRRNAFPDRTLAIVPAGTANDLARTLAVPRNPAQAWALALNGQAAPIDVAFLGERPFLNIAQVGLGAQAVTAAARWGKRLFGRLGYRAAAFAMIFTTRALPMRVTIDGADFFEGPTAELIVANGRYFGHGIPAAPVAECDDGLLEVIAVRATRPAELACLLARAGRGVGPGHPALAQRQGRSVQIAAPAQALVEADGDVVARGPVSIEIAPGALLVVGRWRERGGAQAGHAAVEADGARRPAGARFRARGDRGVDLHLSDGLLFPFPITIGGGGLGGPAGVGGPRPDPP